MTSPRRWLGLLLAAAALAPGRLRAQGVDSIQVQPVIVELMVGRDTTQTVSAYRVGGEALLPLSQLAGLAEIRSRPLPGGITELVFEPGDRRVTVDPAQPRIHAGDSSIAVGPLDRLTHEGEQYLATRIMGALLGVRFAVDWNELSVAIVDAESLPIARRMARERARSEFVASTDQQHSELTIPMERSRWDGVVLDYSILAPSNDLLGSGAYSAGVGLNVLGGSLETSLATEGAPRDGNLRLDASWTGVWRDNAWVSQLRVGDGLSTGPRPRTVRGFSISNSPFLRPSLFGNIPYGGVLGPGWQIEAYRGGRLIAIDSANALGQFSVDVPVQYGQNPVDFIAYGPFGEMRQFNQTYRVTDGAIPARRFEYGVSLGGCRTALCRASGNLDMRYGITRRWTLRSGVDQFWRDSLPTLFHPYVGLSGSLGNAWAVELEAVAAAVMRGVLRFEPSTNLMLSTEYDDFASGTVAPILTPAGRETEWTTEALARPFGTKSNVYFQGSLDRITAATGNSISGRLSVSLYAGQIRMEPAVRFVGATPQLGGPAITQSYYSINAFSLPFPRLGPIFGRISSRGSWEVDGTAHTSSAAGYLSRELGRSLRIEAGAGWTRGIGTVFSAFLSTQLPSIRATTTATAPVHGQASAVQFVQGSLLYDPARSGVAFAGGPSVERAGVSGRVFLDENGDGKYEEGEPLLSGVRVRAGFGSGVSDSSGRYRIWDLPPFEPVLVAIDSNSLASPLWVPAYGSMSVELGPNRFRRLDIPVAPGGVIEGRVLRQSVDGTEPVPVPGARLFLKNRATRDVRALATFSDGDFYLIGVKPGDYDLWVDPGTLSRLGLTGAPISFTMHASPDGASVEGLELKLK